MAIDARISDAVRTATDDTGQPRTVADRLLAWFKGLASGNERLEDPDTVERHLELLFQATIVPDVDRDGGQE